MASQLLPQVLDASEKFIEIIQSYGAESEPSSVTTKSIPDNVLVEQLCLLREKLSQSMFIDADGIGHLTQASADPLVKQHLASLTEQVVRLDFESGMQTIDVIVDKLVNAGSLPDSSKLN